MSTPPAGRIPFAIRIGVTGHRQLPDAAAILPAVRTALSLIRSMAPDTVFMPVRTVIVSALAEGADRLLAEEVLRDPSARLEAALPLASDDYAADFATADSKTHFWSLLERASEQWQAEPSETREAAYEQAGRYVVDRADAIIALWDGRPSRGRGGTAEIVAYARDNEVPLVWVHTESPYPVSNQLGTARWSVVSDAANELSKFNAAAIRPRRFEKREASQRVYWGVPRNASDPDGPPGRGWLEVSASMLPLFVRADLLALRQQRWFRGLDVAAFLMAAAAVTVVAVQTSFIPGARGVVWAEVALLAALVLLPLLNRWWRFHDRWIAYRFLAERLRSAYFLHLAGTGDRRHRSSRLAYFSDSADLWIERALEEVAWDVPNVEPGDASVTALRSYLSKYWIADQLRYHMKTSRRDRIREDRWTVVTALLFTVTLVTAVAHVFGLGGRDGELSLAALFVMLSISLPALGAAVHGIRTQRQFRRQAERYKRMTSLLERLQKEMDGAETSHEIQTIAADTERIMREENGDWFGVMRFFDMELIT